MKAWKIIVAGIVFAIIAQIIHTIEAFYTMDFYKDPTYYTVWSKLMMSTAGPPTMLLVYWAISALIIDLIGGVVIARIMK